MHQVLLESRKAKTHGDLALAINFTHQPKLKHYRSKFEAHVENIRLCIGGTSSRGIAVREHLWWPIGVFRNYALGVIFPSIENSLSYDF